MAILSASAKLYTGIRCWCVDKNISAALSSSFSVGNKNRPASEGDTVFANVLAFRVKRTVADITTVPTVSLADSKLKTFGGGNVINDGYFVLGQRYKILVVGNSDWNAIAGTTGITYVIGSEFVAVNNGTLPLVTPPITSGDKRNPTAKTGKANLASWTIRSSVVCKFPTYFRVDVEKLQLPEGTTCTVSFEEGWIKDGEYAGTTQSPSLAVPNFFTFRTPWFGVGRLTSAFTLPTRTALKIKQLASSVSSQASITAFPVRNPGRLAALFGGAFTTTPNATKKVVVSADFYNVFGPFGPIALGLRIKQLASSLTSASSFNIDTFDIVQVSGMQANATSTVSAEGFKFKGVGNNILAAVSTLTAAGVNTASGISLRGATASLTALISVTRIASAARSSVFTLSANVIQNQAAVRWRSTAVVATIGNGANVAVQTNNESSKMAIYRYSDGGFRTYTRTGGVITGSSTINLGISNTDKNRVGINKDIGIIAATTGANSTSWKMYNVNAAQTYTITGEAYVLTASATQIWTWNGTDNSYKNYNSNGTLGSTYSQLQNRGDAPYTMAVSSNSSSGFNLLISALQNGNIFMWHNQGAQTTQTFALSNLTSESIISIADDGATFAVSTPNNQTVYIYGRSGTANNTTTLLQTITGTDSAYGRALSLGANGQHLLIGKEYWIRSGNTFTRSRDVDFLNGDYFSPIKLAFDSNDNSVEAVYAYDSDLAVFTYS